MNATRDNSAPAAYGTTSGIVSSIRTEASLALKSPEWAGTPAEEIAAYREALETILAHADRADGIWRDYVRGGLGTPC
jgi:hypothetical protein